VRVRFGMADTAREVDIEVDDTAALIDDVERAMSEGDKLLWVTTEEGRRYGLVVDRIVFVDVEPAKQRTGIGFSAP
jgi:hypothetical protein